MGRSRRKGREASGGPGVPEGVIGGRDSAVGAGGKRCEAVMGSACSPRYGQSSACGLLPGSACWSGSYPGMKSRRWPPGRVAATVRFRHEKTGTWRLCAGGLGGACVVVSRARATGGPDSGRLARPELGSVDNHVGRRYRSGFLLSVAHRSARGGRRARFGRGTGALFPSGGGLRAGHGGETSLAAALRRRGRHLPERAPRGVR